MAGAQPSFTYEQWEEFIPKITTPSEYAAYEEMLRSDCRLMLGTWGISKVTDLTDAMRKQLQSIQGNTHNG